MAYNKKYLIKHAYYNKNQKCFQDIVFGILNKLSCSGYAEGDCVVPAMGLKENEECDNPLGNSNDPLAAGDEPVCRENCKYSKCGDGILDFGESCDCGVAGLYAEDEWPDTIHQFAVEQFETDASGNRIPIKDKQDKWIYPCVYKNAAGEDIRDYNTYSATRSGTCRPDCKLSTCGDGIKGLDEACDDGNLSNDDSCLEGCQHLDSCGDGYFSSKRSYLCEELLGTITNSEIGTDWEGTGVSLFDLQNKWSTRGVVECGPGKKKSCDELKSELTTGRGIYSNLIAGVIHCCFNPKLIGDADDHNCEIQHATDEGWDTPRDRALQRCMTTYRKNGYQDDKTYVSSRDAAQCEEDGLDDQLERCEFNAKRFVEECESEFKGDKNKERRELCIAQLSNYHNYCDRFTCYNVTGGCGDGKRNYVGDTPIEECDSNLAGQEGFYYNIDGTKIYVASGGQGKYCTGRCRGNCDLRPGDIQAPMCSDEVLNDCWEYNSKETAEEYWGSVGCTDYKHKDQTQDSKCGDNKIDTFADEVCDDGINNKPGGYCSENCKSKPGRCGDGIKQNDFAEKCDRKVFEDGESCDATIPVCDAKPGCPTSHPNDCSKVKGKYCSDDCQEDYGSCGDGKVTGKGINLYDGWVSGNEVDGYDYHSLITLAEPNKEAGPEDCDKNDNRTKTLLNALYLLSGEESSNLDAKKDEFFESMCPGCKKTGRCGDGTRNYRFEGCDCGNGNSNGSGTCAPVSKSGNLTLSDLVGYECHANCHSDPIGQVYIDQITPTNISGWACDPDHPMINGKNYDMVKIKFINANGEEAKNAAGVTVAPIILKTGQDVPQSYNGNEHYREDVVTICGGGSGQGWNYNLSLAGINPAEGPYTIKVYAIPLKTGTNPVDGNENEVLIGTKTNFITAMQCGDGVVTKCSSLSVMHKDDTVEFLSNGWTCDAVKNAELKGGCAGNGFEIGEKCVDENCDNTPGTRFGCLKVNEDDDTLIPCSDSDPNTYDNADCYSAGDNKCQWTWCGDGIVQEQASTERQHSGIPGNPEEECDSTSLPATLSDSEAAACSTLGLEKPTGEAATVSDTITGKAKICKNTCKYKREYDADKKTGCQLQSTCPSLEDVVDGWIKKNPGETAGYDKGQFANYVSYHKTTYLRNWECNAAGECGWSGTKEADYKSKYVDNSDDEYGCFFYCNEGLVWDEGKKFCAPISATNTTGIKTSCNECSAKDTSPAGGIWNKTDGGACSTTTDGPATTKEAYIGTVVEDVTIENVLHKGVVCYIVPQPDGTEKKVPVGGLVPRLDAKYDDSASPTYQCSWKCGSNSKYSEKKNKCYKEDKTYTCKDKPPHSVWVEVLGVEEDDDGVVTGVKTKILGSDDKLEVSQRINDEFDPSGVAKYNPDDTAKYTATGYTDIGILDPVYINEPGISAFKQRYTLKKYDGNSRCFWVCEDNYVATKGNGSAVYDTCEETSGGATADSRCPVNGTTDRIYNEDCSNVVEAYRCEVRIGYHQRCNDTYIPPNQTTGISYNGEYGSWTFDADKVDDAEWKGVTVSHCNTTCGEKQDSSGNWIEDSEDELGRILKKDSNERKFYCGDGFTQAAPGSYGLDNFSEATLENYSGAKTGLLSGSNAVDEYCDGTDYTRHQLCDRYLSKFGATIAPEGIDYYNNSSIKCNSTCNGMTKNDGTTSISGTSKNNINYTDTNYPCGFCGDGKINKINDSGAKEGCDEGLNASGGYGSDKWTSDFTNSTGTTRKCKTDCTGWAPYCGDGNTDPGETCDKYNGTANNDGWTQEQHCKANCSGWAPYCGDGTVQSDNETCEPNSFSSSTCYKQTSTESVDCTGGCGTDFKRYFDIYTSSCSGCSIKWTKTGSTSKCYDSSSSAIGFTLCSF